MTTDEAILRDLALALAPEERVPPTERVAAVRAAAIDRAPVAAGTTAIGPRLANRRRRIGAVAAVAAAAFGLGGVVFDRVAPREGLLAGGVTEFEVLLADPEGTVTATAVGIRTGIGRTVQLRTDDLPILPTGDLYELWFVGPGDAPGVPNRISAGTFHPDERGRSHVDLTAAVDPSRYPELSLTAEPGDGDPAPTGPEVLRAPITLEEP